MVTRDYGPMVTTFSGRTGMSCHQAGMRSLGPVPLHDLPSATSALPKAPDTVPSEQRTPGLSEASSCRSSPPTPTPPQGPIPLYPSVSPPPYEATQPLSLYPLGPIVISTWGPAVPPGVVGDMRKHLLEVRIYSTGLSCGRVGSCAPSLRCN